MHRLAVIVGTVLVACGPPSRPDSARDRAAEAGDGAQVDERPRPQGSELRFLRDGELTLLYDEVGQVFANSELLGVLSGRRLLDPDGSLVATVPDGPGPILDPEGGELPFVLLDDGTLLLEGQAEPARILETGELLYPALGTNLGVLVQGATTPERRRTAMLLVLFQSGFLSQRFRESLRRAKAREVSARFEELAGLLEEGRERGDAPTDSLGPTPDLGCDARPWPADAEAAWRTLGFAPEAPVRFSYTVQPTDAGYRLIAEADLDCDGTTSRYEQDLVAASDGSLEAAEIESDRPLE